MAVVESTKAASDVYAPVAGEVIAVNDALVNAPELVNASPYGDGWLVRVRPAAGADVAALLDAAAYARVVADDQH
jgi:glycine cleavage system H protein